MHCAIVRCAFKITLTTMAPIITAAKTATYASPMACTTLRVARPDRQSLISRFSSRGVAGTSGLVSAGSS